MSDINNQINENNEAVAKDSIYQYNKEQLQEQWRPNTGAFYTESEPVKKKKSKKPKKPVTRKGLVAAMVATALVTTGANVGVNLYFDQQAKETYATKTEMAANNLGVTSSYFVSSSGEINPETHTVTDVANAVLPSVVSITSTAIVESNYNPFFGGGGSYQVTGAGSGIIIGTNETELLIVTNNHVVEGTNSLTVEFCDGEAIKSAYVKGTNASNDLAVVGIKLDDIDKDTYESIKIAVIGNSDNLSVGDGVVAIGNALGYGQSVTSGVVSAIGRTISLENGDITVIQTDASINGGNSGGALVNMYGEVIGINVAKASSSSSQASVEGMGYAIPVSEVTDIISDLVNTVTRVPVATADKGYMGITSASYVEVDKSTSNMYNIPVGVYLREVSEGTPLFEAGVEEGDVITGVNGVEILTYQDLLDEMKYYEAGETITLTIEVKSSRSYKEKEVEVKLVTYDEIEKLLNN